jgi:hypothetical protein
VAVAYLRRKVDQQIGFSNDLLKVAEVSESKDALCNALCLQLEQALCFYLLEVARASGNKRWSHGWTLDAKVLMGALESVPGADFQELVDLSQEPDSWLADLLGGLQSLRRTEEPQSLKAELFQSDFVETQPRLIGSSSAAFPLLPEWENLVRITEAMNSVIRRQRLGHEEY